MLEITDIRAILTAPAGTDLVVVKVETSEPELYGLGCATYTQRAVAVGHVVDHYLKPLLVGRDARRIEDIWQSVAGSAYWRNGPVLNNALSGVDEALWDITGKLAGLPVYQLLGGKCRDAATVYRHADGRTLEEVEQKARSLMAEGITHVRCQFGGYGGSGVRGEAAPDWAASGAVGSVAVFDPAVYARNTRRLFEHMRSALGEEVELLHDVHERLAPPDAVRLASDLDQYRLFFLEDALSPEHPEWWPRLRQHSVTPIAMGELFNHPLEWQPLVQNQLIDYLRIHISQIGGITPARKVTHLCETYGVRTAWHGPGDVSPVGHAAQVHLDLAAPNFGIQEWAGIDERLQEVFPGSPRLVGGAVTVSDAPGLGVDLDEEAAKRFPIRDQLPGWTHTRLPDGTVVRP